MINGLVIEFLADLKSNLNSKKTKILIRNTKAKGRNYGIGYSLAEATNDYNENCDEEINLQEISDALADEVH